MIGCITGILLEKIPPHLLADCNGIGYEIDVPMSTFYNLPSTGNKVTLLTQLIVREDAHLLYGFLTQQERQIFRELLKISGIGARIALAILSGMSVMDFSRTVALQDTTRLIRVPGIGKKTAERLLLELKGRLEGDINSATSDVLPLNYTPDILNALISLGYSEKEALSAVKHVPVSMDVSSGIKLALKILSKV
ncbi:Holliday junction branch migration protein RuvA [Candidatus Vallotia lariciata]|uniref:Holliday junction branch migration protein RuvA n=1 Tax=Candidatus Vallotia laricis TaxID=2018052 RepID=UPI001D00245F|nr:Holliday junction branch migration protein RuvA [Candidatus Vallotia lariciata]UDG83291.1 Holliday junction ATP-dependent DNA helicase RuvA [Candidatus Vallotia lariciata]